MPPQETNFDLSLIIILVGIAIMVILTIGVFIFVLFYQKKLLLQKNISKELEINHQKEMTQTILKSEESERRKIAANLHDDLGAILNTAKLTVGRVEALTSDTNSKALIHNLRELLTDSIATVRSVSQDLASPVLEKFGLLQAMSDLIQQLDQTANIEASFFSLDSEIKIEKETEIQAFRIIKEIITNIIKHANADVLSLNVKTKNNNTVTFKIFHNGKGINTEDFISISKTSKGLGLANLLSRTESINGTLDFRVFAADDASVKLIIPLQQ